MRRANPANPLFMKNIFRKTAPVRSAVVECMAVFQHNEIIGFSVKRHVSCAALCLLGVTGYCDLMCLIPA